MTVMEMARHTGDDMLASVRRLGPLLQEHADESERLRRPNLTSRDLILDSGAIQMMMPQEYGGSASSLHEIAEALEEVSFWEASTGWLLRGLMTETALAACHLPDESAEELFGGSQSTVVAGISSGQVGYATQLPDGGYSITGRWRYVPGASLATHFSIAVQVETESDVRICVVPRWMVALHDNWEMLALQASAAFDVEATDLVIDSKYTFSSNPTARKRGGPSSLVARHTLAASNHAAWSLGLSRRMLHELCRLLHTEAHSRPGSEQIFEALALLDVELNAMRSFLMQVLRRLQATMEAGEPVDPQDESLVGLLCVSASRSSVEISHRLHRHAGSAVMRNGSIQRLFREAQVGAQHSSVAQEVALHLGLAWSDSIGSVHRVGA